MGQIFVYGSLRRGMYNYVRFLEGKSTFIGYGYVQGELYALQGVTYPALLPGDDMISGEVYEIDHDVAKAIDELEGYDPGSDFNHYDKVWSEITMKEDHTKIQLPVYIFNMKDEKNRLMLGEKINAGDYLSYMLDQS